MSGALIKWELKKLWSLPMLPVFLALCLGLDLLVIGSAWYGQRDAAEAVEYIGEVTAQAGTRMGPALDQALSALPESRWRDGLAACLAGTRDVYEDLDAAELGDGFLRQFGVTGPMGERIREKFARFQTSVDRLAALDVSMDAAAASVTSDLYSLLLVTVCRLLIAEGALLAMLLALYAAGSEKVSRTAQTVYATRRGRTVQQSKYAAGLLSALGSYTLLCLATLGAFALLWRLGPMWSESVSTQFYILPIFGYFLTWRPFTLAGYLAAELAMGLGLVAVFHGLAAGAGLLAGDMYRGFLGLFTLLAASFAVVTAAGNGGMWTLYEAGYFLPTMLWANTGQWFTHGSISTLFRGQELAVLLLWLVLAGLLAWGAYRRFLRKDVA